jgi:hypothetical protein
VSKTKLVRALLTLFVVLPIWFFLLYSVLVRVDASELMWFLFWVYMPVTVFARVLADLADDPPSALVTQQFVTTAPDARTARQIAAAAQPFPRGPA